MNERLQTQAAALAITLSTSLIFAVTSGAFAGDTDGIFKTHQLETLDAEFASGRHGYIDGLLVLHHGKVVLQSRYQRDYTTPFEKIDSQPEEAISWGQGKEDYYYLDPKWHPWLKGGDLHTVQSVTKSVTSALIGIAILRGEIDSVDIKVAPLLDGPHLLEVTREPMSLLCNIF